MISRLSVLLASLFVTVSAFAGTANLTWTHPTQRVDGAALALSEVKETKIEWAKCPVGVVFPATIDGTKVVAAPAVTTSIPDLPYGRWCYRAYTVDINGLASDPSGVVFNVFVAPPKPPVIVTVQGIVWEMKLHPTDGPYLARVVGEVAAGKPCQGTSPQLGFDLFVVNRKDVTLAKGVKPSGTLVAQCAIT